MLISLNKLPTICLSCFSNIAPVHYDILDNLRWTPESPRLRLTQGRVDEAEEIITKVMRANKREIPDDFRQDMS